MSRHTSSSLLATQADLAPRIENAWAAYIHRENEGRTIGELKSRLSNLQADWKTYVENHHRLIYILSSEEDDSRRAELERNPYFTRNVFDTCSETNLTNQGFFQEEIRILTQENVHNVPVVDIEPVQQQVQSLQLPPIQIEPFFGTFESWITFRDSFTSAMDQCPNLTAVQKLHHLKSSLSGDAKQLVAHLPLTANNFQVAWDLLTQTYENTKFITYSYVRHILDAPVSHGSAKNLKKLHQTLQANIRGLQAIQRPPQNTDDLLIMLTLRKFDKATKDAWENSTGASREPPTWEELNTFLSRRINTLESINDTSLQSTSNRPSRVTQVASHQIMMHKQPEKYTTQTVWKTTSTGRIECCSYCKAKHYISSCYAFRALSLQDRLQFVIDEGLCYNCMGPHKLSSCSTQGRCRACNQSHHTLLHSEDPAAYPRHRPRIQRAHVARYEEQQEDSGITYDAFGSTLQATSDSPDTSSHKQLSASHTSTFRKLPILLATALVNVVDNHGHNHTIRALLDQGSEISIISEKLATVLQLPRTSVNTNILGIGSTRTQVPKGIMFVNIQSTISRFSTGVWCYILPKITGLIPSISVTDFHWPHIKNLSLADPEFRLAGKIDLLLGADIYGKLLLPGIIQGIDTSPTAQSTQLGWIISGSTPPDTSSHIKTIHSYNITNNSDQTLHDLIKQFWLQEDDFLEDNKHTFIQHPCYQEFTRTYTRTPEGRFVVRLPFNTKSIQLGKSINVATKRLHQLEHRFSQNFSLQQSYSAFMQDYLDTGHMSIAGSSNDPLNCYYLPHHGVFKKSSTSTKLRVVFNGSQVTSTGNSLNDLLHEGPKLHRDLADIILRWRVFPYVFAADISKMFRQILVDKRDQNFQRILWRKDTSEPITAFTLNTVTYGTRPAPFLANATLLQLEKEDGAKFPLAASVISDNTYVDDVLSGSFDIETGKLKAKQVLDLFQSGCFPLRKWISSNSQLLSDIPQEFHETKSYMELQGDSVYKMLGVSWNSRQDNFTYTQKLDTSSTLHTKRSVVSQLAQLFDPLGWISPIIVKGKIFTQKLWKLHLDWDQTLPLDLQLEWQEYLNNLSDLSSIKIPRWMGVSANPKSLEFHGFADASQHAIGAVIYLKTIHADDTITIKIVASKSKLAPIQRPNKKKLNTRVTIPRLELSAALLLTKLMNHVQTTLSLPNTTIHLWTDSSISYFWIQGEASRWKEFVRNRVQNIQEILPQASWHHIPGNYNPADIVSRGADPKELKDHNLWWNGPQWLLRTSENWPTLLPSPDPEWDLEEVSKRTHLIQNVITTPAIENEIIERFSSLNTLIKVIGWCRRFKHNATSRLHEKPRQTSHFLTQNEFHAAKEQIETSLQHAHFSSEIKTLLKDNQLSSTHPLLKLGPYLDSKKLLRIGGRLNNAPLPETSKHPIIMPENSHYSTLLLRHIHHSTHHGGAQLMLTKLRQRYWIIGGRRPVRKYLHTCVICARLRGKTLQQVMGQLPDSRVSPYRPFLHTGVDYAGPFNIKSRTGRNVSTFKGYLVVFVCFSTSAVHLDMATDYSTEGFLNAFKRFTSRRGHCAHLYSDCGTNFIGANKELQRIFNKQSKEFNKMAQQLATERTSWHFNPPGAPHFGGKWEAAVKSAKFHIQHIVKDALLTYEEWMTLLTQIEGILNSRPLSSLSDDPNDPEPLTPGHFLIGSPINLIPESNSFSVSEPPINRLQKHKYFLAEFWKRWSDEYLQKYLIRPKWNKTETNIQLGSLVAIRDERFPTYKWPLGKVIQLHPGKDDHVRVVTIKTASSTLTRPITKLCLLPIEPLPLTPSTRQGGENVHANKKSTSHFTRHFSPHHVLQRHLPIVSSLPSKLPTELTYQTPKPNSNSRHFNCPRSGQRLLNAPYHPSPAKNWPPGNLRHVNSFLFKSTHKPQVKLYNP